MTDEILINATSREVRAALVENGVLQEILIERESRRGLISNIYKGRVSRVLPGMQAAFVDLGLERTAFLHASDIAHNPHDEEPARNGEANIRDFVHEGQELLVQVLKDPLGTKGARLTTYVTIPSRYLVMTPYSGGVGVSSRIEDEAERERLRTAVEGIAGRRRTQAAASCARQRRARRRRRSRRISRFCASSGKPSRRRPRITCAGQLVHEDLPLALRVLRDLLSPDVTRVRVDSAAHLRAYPRVRGALHAALRGAHRAVLAMRGRSSICTESRTKSPRRSIARCR